MLWMEEVSLKKHPRTLFQKTIFCPQIHFDENVSFFGVCIVCIMSKTSGFLVGDLLYRLGWDEFHKCQKLDF